MASRSARRTGFALPAVLAVTGLVTIVFLVAMTALSSLNAEAASARARVNFVQRAMSTEATLAFMMATEPFSITGIDVGRARSGADPGLLEEGVDEVVTSGLPRADIRFDGRPYFTPRNGPMIISLRDQAGMINLAYLSPERTSRLLERLGVPPSFERRLTPRLQDYVDADSVKRIEGAEGSDYGAGLGPANRDLRRVDEWLSVLGVREAVTPRAWRDLRDDLVVDHTLVRENVNTASAKTLEVLFGADAQQAAAAIRLREQQPFLSFDQFAAAAGLPNISDPQAIYTFPSGRVVVSLRDAASPWIYRTRITVTPSGLERPVWIDQTDMLEAPRRQAAETKDVPGFPYTPY